MSNEVVYTIAELARMLKVSEKTIRVLIDAGELEAFKVGNQWRISHDAVERYKKKRSRQ